MDKYTLGNLLQWVAVGAGAIELLYFLAQHPTVLVVEILFVGAFFVGKYLKDEANKIRY